jgi:hypothetical protein
MGELMVSAFIGWVFKKIFDALWNGTRALCARLISAHPYQIVRKDRLQELEMCEATLQAIDIARTEVAGRSVSSKKTDLTRAQ